MQRRNFLKLGAYFCVAAQSVHCLSACSKSKGKKAASGEMAFIHGVASADPRDSSVMLWTRVTPLEDSSGYVNVRLQLASDESFTALITDVTVQTDEESDYTLRFLVSNLDSDSIYYYRFIANEKVTSMTGRTWTAPALDADVPIYFASANCQNREHGFYSAYALMRQEDNTKPREQQIRFVLHLGDFIYETRNDALQYPVNENGERVTALIDEQGKERIINPFPNGDILPDGSEYAVSLNDYRHLYKTYLLDPELQAARAHWPFITIWDDHEFTDDYWQSEANYDDSGIESTSNEPSQPRKVAANQAWYEYVPVDYTPNPLLENIPHYAKPFTKTRVGESFNNDFDENGLANNSDNLRAINSLTIFRSLSFGKNLQLVLTDCRSYRSDHAMPEDISGNFPQFVHSRIALPLSLVNTLDAGKQANNGAPPIFLDLPVTLKNPNINRPPGSMLGSVQKQWWKQILLQSQAKWKIWSNSVPLMRFGIDVSAMDIGIDDIMMSSDTWDGYNFERRELLNYLYENNIQNVISIAGDVHAFYAGKVLNEYDNSAEQHEFSIPEFVCGAVSSITQFQALKTLSLRENPDETERLLRDLIIYQDQHSGEEVCNFNTTLLRGTAAALAAAQAADVNATIADTAAPLNPHLMFADSSEHGYSLFVADSDKFNAEFVAVNTTLVDPAAKNPEALRRSQFEVTAQSSTGHADIVGPVISGKPPYPLKQ